MKTKSEKVFCPILNRKIEVGYCWELCNIGTDEILLEGDKVDDWDKAQKICDKCGLFNERGY